MHVMGLGVIQIAVGGYDNNFSHIIFDKESERALIVDPSGDLSLILTKVDELNLDVVGVLLTHSHGDHSDALDALLASYRVPVYMHAYAEEKIPVAGVVRIVGDGDQLELGGKTINVMYTPGHSNDSLCFYIDKKNSDNGLPKLITGDTLFVEGCGRTNEQDVQDLYESLERLKALPRATEVYPGHNYGSQPYSSIGYEHDHNRFFHAEDFDRFKQVRLYE